MKATIDTLNLIAHVCFLAGALVLTIGVSGTLWHRWKEVETLLGDTGNQEDLERLINEGEKDHETRALVRQR